MRTRSIAHPVILSKVQSLFLIKSLLDFKFVYSSNAVTRNEKWCARTVLDEPAQMVAIRTLHQGICEIKIWLNYFLRSTPYQF